MERLQKVLAQAGVASRRKSEKLIAAGKVKVNGKVVTKLGTKVDPAKDKIEVNGKLLEGNRKKVYIMINKPRGYVTTVSDPQRRKKVIDILKGIKERVYPVGRLDKDTEGLLLLTNDGELAYRLTHPRYKVYKTYQVRVEGNPPDDKLLKMAKGLILEDGPTAPAFVRRIGVKGENALIELTIREGRKRQVRRMCRHIGHPVLELKRISFGPLRLGSLRPGEYRNLSPKEVQALKSEVGLT